MAGPAVEDGRMPVLARLMEEGRWGDLRSTVPPLTPPGWTTAFTGVPPSVHNILDFFTPAENGHDLKLVDWRAHRSPALWEMLSQAGGSVGVFGAPVTYPPDPVKGWMVSRMGVPPSAGDWTSPGELGGWIHDNFPGYSHGLSVKSLQGGGYDSWEKELYRFTDLYEALVLRLLKERPVETVVVVVDELDRLQHFFWHFCDPGHPAHPGNGKYSDAIPAYYGRLDSFLGKLLDAAPWDNVLILSDHGFGPLNTDVFLNQWLIERKLLRLKGRVARWKLQRRVNGGEKVGPFDWFDWKTSRIHLASVSGRSLYENPENVLSNAEREDLRRELLELRDGSGTKIINGAHTGEELWGPGEHSLCWVLEEAEGFALRSELTGTLTAPSTQHGVLKTGSHRPEGMGLVWGRGIEAGKLPADAVLAEVTLTALDLMDLPFPVGASGRSWAGGERPAGDWKLLGKRAGGYEDGESKAVQDHLRSLGYL